MCRHQCFIDEALREASKSPMYQQLGAVVVRNRIIIGKGFNYYKHGHPKRSIHAEASAIMDANGRVKGCYLYVCRNKRLNGGRISKPCSRCQQLIYNVGIRRTFFHL
jgi:deoxycytidylate deaminase